MDQQVFYDHYVFALNTQYTTTNIQFSMNEHPVSETDFVEH